VAVEPGQELLHYRLVEKIGEGGMGVVWKAVDTTLDREVAIKVLPEGFASDTERLARFEREAKLLASLNHPNIATIHGLHETGGRHFLAMELVPGEDLSARLARGALPVDEALDVAAQIAEALVAAHDAGVIHRDLKPANVKLSPDGKIKVLDFGLAKGIERRDGSGSLSMSPTVTSAGTLPGVILGTASYMSPEQARGKVVDRRTDLWSFGCVLYEMLTGKRAFDGETASDVVARILQTEPDLELLPAETSDAVRRLLRRCLAKDPGRRMRDAGDARLEIEEISPSTDVSRTAGRLVWPAWVTAGVTSAVALGLLLFGRGGSPPDVPRRTTRLTMVTPEEAPYRWGDTNRFALSPDGSLFVYIAAREGGSELVLRSLEDGSYRWLEGTRGGQVPFFSPDMQWIGFDARGLRKIGVDGGAPLTLVSTGTTTNGATWVDDGSIVYSPVYTEGLFRLDEGGESPERLTSPDREAGELGHWWPHAPAGADYVLYTRWKTTLDDCSVWKVSLETGEDERIVDRACQPLTLPTGHVLFARAGAVMAMPFDLDRGTVSGTATVVLDGVAIDANDGRVHMSFSNDGTLAYVASEQAGTRAKLAWIDLDGNVTPLTSEVRNIVHVRIAPDGRKIAMQIDDKTGEDVWIHDVERDSARRFTLDGTNGVPVWSRDGNTIVFQSLRLGPYDLFSKPLDESRGAEPLYETPDDKAPGDWTPDGRRLVYWRSETNDDLWAVDASGDAQRLTETPSDERTPRVSPDGRWIAHVSNASGRQEIYVMAMPPASGRWQISADGGTDPCWSPDGRTLFYVHRGAVYSVSIASGERLTAGRPRMLFDEERVGGVLVAFDVHPDGERFVAVLGERRASTPIEIVLNWFDEVRRLAP
jgi:serine/threonine-protein kinase